MTTANYRNGLAGRIADLEAENAELREQVGRLADLCLEARRKLNIVCDGYDRLGWQTSTAIVRGVIAKLDAAIDDARAALADCDPPVPGDGVVDVEEVQ